jgi:hypothetical protein
MVEFPLLKIYPKTSLKIKTIKNNVSVRLVIKVASTGKIFPGLSHKIMVNMDTISNWSNGWFNKLIKIFIFIEFIW